MKLMKSVVAIALALAPMGRAALKPVDGAIQPEDNKSVAVFKTTPQGDLKINLYFPPDWKPTDRRPAIVFFFGGGFTGGDPVQFKTKSEYLASRGMVAAAAEYRIKNKHHTDPVKSMEDSKSAVRWMRLNARRLGIDPDKLLAGGGSSGGACAVYTAFNTSFEPEGEDTSVSSMPNALVLYNPYIGTASDKTERDEPNPAWRTDWKVTRHGPPAILFFGTDDALLAPARIFVQQMAAAGNRVELYTAEGQKHGFFNDRGGTPWHAVTLRQTDVFLTSLGYLKGAPTIAPPAGSPAVLKRETP